MSLLLAQAPAAPKKTPLKTSPKTPAAKTAAPKTAMPKTSPPAAAMTDDQKIVYSLGLSIHRSLADFDLSPAEIELVKKALTDAAMKKPAVELNEWLPKIQTLVQARKTQAAAKEKVASAAYLTKAAGELGAMKTDSGLIYKQLTAGTGPSPKATDTVKVHYRGTLTNGTEFDSSYKRNEPAQFGLSQVIPCWTEGVQKMKVGEKAMLVCPSSIAYGDAGRPSIPGGATLIFEIELLEIAGAKP